MRFDYDVSRACFHPVASPPTPLLPEVVPEIDANPVSFYWRRGEGVGHVWGLTRQSLLYVNFKVVVLEFAYK